MRIRIWFHFGNISLINIPFLTVKCYMRSHRLWLYSTTGFCLNTQINMRSYVSRIVAASKKEVYGVKSFQMFKRKVLHNFIFVFFFFFPPFFSSLSIDKQQSVAVATLELIGWLLLLFQICAGAVLNYLFEWEIKTKR